MDKQFLTRRTMINGLACSGSAWLASQLTAAQNQTPRRIKVAQFGVQHAHAH